MQQYSGELSSFIFENYKGISTQELTERVNARFGLAVRESQIRAYKDNHKLASGAPMGNRPGSCFVFTAEQQAFIAQNVKGTVSFDLTKMLNTAFKTNFKRSQIKAYMSNHRLSNGVDCRKRKGQAAPNKGKKWDDFMSKESQEASRRTTFKPGQIPLNHKPVGSERVNVDGYVEIKVAEPNRRKGKHRVLYEQAHGPLPKGFMLIFLDRDKLNLSLDNLALISRAENARLNKCGLRFNDRDLTQAGIGIAKMKTAIGKRSKREG